VLDEVLMMVQVEVEEQVRMVGMVVVMMDVLEA